MLHPDLVNIKFTKIQLELLNILADGQGHTKEELLKAFGPCSKSNIWTHMFLLRKRLALAGHTIVPVYTWRKALHYRHVISLKPNA